MKKSTRHHYIPQFYAKGFTDKDGLFYVYDKQKNEIIKTKRSPKSVFYGIDKYTIRTEDGESTILEDKLYSDLDNKCATAIRNFRDLDNTEDLHSNDNVAFIRFFVVNLVWRIPANDGMYDEYYNRIDIVFEDGNGNVTRNPENEAQLKSSDDYKKMVRFIVPINMIMEVSKERSGGQSYSALIDKKYPFFLLTDNPIVFKKTPKTIKELVQSEFLLPLSYNRIYSTEENANLDFTPEKAAAFNMLQILQAKHYVCSPDLEVLKSYVNLYKVTTLMPQRFIDLHNILFNQPIEK